MTDTAPPAPSPPSWAPAEAAAAQHRNRRLHPDPRSQQRSSRLGVIAVVLWVIALVLAIASFATPGLLGGELALIGYAVLFAYVAIALLWGTFSGRYLLRGNAFSIRSTLPMGTWHTVRRQLAGRSRIDPEHRDVVIELAHQQRRLTEGMVGFAGFYIVLYVAIAHSNSGWLRYGLLLFGAASFIWGVIAGITWYRQLKRLTDSDAD